MTMTTILTEAIDNVKAYRQAFSDLFDKMEEIRKKYEASSKGNYPTFQWIAGKFKQLYNIPQVEKSVESGTVDSPEKQEEYEKILALKDIGLKYKFISKDGTNYKMTNLGSGFVQFLSTHFQSLKDLQANFREVNYDENQEWYKKLPADQKKIVDTYSQLSPTDYAYLIGLVNKQKSKGGYIDNIQSSLKKDGDKITRLQGLGLLNDDYTLNKDNIEKMLDFLNDNTYARLKGFNKNIAYVVDRISADKALIRNALERSIDRTSMRRPEMAGKSDAIVDQLNDNDKQGILAKYQNRSSRSALNQKKLSSLGIIDNSGALTDMGKYIAVVLTKLSRNDRLGDTGEKGTQYSRLRKSDVGGDFNASTRRNERAGSRAGSFKDFLKQR
jgi:hypothetical protein